VAKRWLGRCLGCLEDRQEGVPRKARGTFFKIISLCLTGSAVLGIFLAHASFTKFKVVKCLIEEMQGN